MDPAEEAEAEEEEIEPFKPSPTPFLHHRSPVLTQLLSAPISPMMMPAAPPSASTPLSAAGSPRSLVGSNGPSTPRVPVRSIHDKSPAPVFLLSPSMSPRPGWLSPPHHLQQHHLSQPQQHLSANDSFSLDNSGAPASRGASPVSATSSNGSSSAMGSYTTTSASGSAQFVSPFLSSLNSLMPSHNSHSTGSVGCSPFHATAAQSLSSSPMVEQQQQLPTVPRAQVPKELLNSPLWLGCDVTQHPVAPSPAGSSSTPLTSSFGPPMPPTPSPASSPSPPSWSPSPPSAAVTVQPQKSKAAVGASSRSLYHDSLTATKTPHVPSETTMSTSL